MTDNNGWISVKEALPNNNDNVLIYNPKMGENIDVAFFDGKYNEWNGLSSVWLNNIIHWQPLPAPPTKQ